MYLSVVSSHEKILVTIEPVNEKDFKGITKKDFSFNWKLEKGHPIYKIATIDNGKIMGLMSIEYFDEEQRIEIRLIALRKEQIGGNKKYDRIAGNLIAFIGRQALLRYGAFAGISLLPKTKLRQHYITNYGFVAVAQRLFLSGVQLEENINRYSDD